jgi:hypothetical protein
MFKFSVRREVEWCDLERLCNDLVLSDARGVPRLRALADALEGSSATLFRALAPSFRIPMVDAKNFVFDAFSGIKDAELKATCESLFPLLLRGKDGVCRIPIAVAMLSQIATSSQWISQQLANGRAQARFLIFFVPVVSCIFLMFGIDVVIKNMSDVRGRIVLAAACSLYATGCVCLRQLALHSKSLVLHRSVEFVSGRALFLRSLMLSAEGPGRLMESLGHALSRLPENKWQGLSRSARFAFLSPPKVGSKNLFNQAELKFLDSVKAGCLSVSPEERRNWMERSHATLLDSMRAALARKVASLNLQFLIVMAIFFLPALFLMLWLSGTTPDPGTIG